MTGHEIRRRRFLQLAAGLGAFGLVGCARTEDTGGRGGGGQASGGSGVLRIADPSYTLPIYKKGIDAVTTAFAEAHPDITVEQIAPPYAQYRGAIETQLQAGSPPDLIRVDPPQMASWIDRGWLTPLDDVLEAAGVTVDDLIPANRDAYLDGHLYALVKEANPRALIYNTDLYAQADVEVPTNAASFEDVLRRTTNAGEGVFGTGIATKEGDPTGLFNQLMPFVYGFGGAFFNGAEPTAATPENIEALEFVKMLWDDNLTPRALDAVTVTTMFSQGKIANMINSAYNFYLATEESAAVGDALASAPIPLPSGIVMHVSNFWAVPADAQNADAALLFLETYLQPEVMSLLQSATAIVPARREGISEEFIAENSWFQPFMDNIDQAVSYFPQSAGPKGAEAIAVIGDGVFEILYNGRAVTEALTGVQDELEKLMQG